MILLLACVQPDPEPPASADLPFRRTADGRLSWLRGANVTGSNKYTPDLLAPNPDAFSLLPAEGVGLARFLVFWQGVEPEPGVYDDAYLEGVHAQIAALDALGVSVVLDMHQDVWGEGFGYTGAPDWSCDAANYATFEPSPVSWSLDYFSDEVTACFDTFWADPALQDRYAAMYAHVAESLGDIDGIVAWEVMNEPFWGSTAPEAYEAQALAPFYERVAGAIVAVDASREIWVEPGLHVSTFLEPSSLPDLDVPDARFVLAPHLYPPWTEAEAYPETLEDEAALLADLQGMAAGYGWPMAVSETGTHLDQAGAADYLRDLSVLGDGAGFDVAWWAFDPQGGFGLLNSDGTDWGEVAKAGFAAPSVVASPGVPAGATWDGQTFTLSLTAIPDVPAELVLAVPDGTWGAGVDPGGDVRAVALDGRRAVVTLSSGRATWDVRLVGR